jgi:HEAT repeat protein
MQPFSAHHEFLRQLANRDDQDALMALANAARDTDPFVRRTAVETIGRHPLGRSLQSVILGAIKDPSGYVVRTACEVVALWKLSEAHELLLDLLDDASPATRQSAVRALNAVWADADFPLLLAIWAKDLDRRVCKEAAFVLRERATSQNWWQLFDRFSGDDLARHRQWACELAESFASADVLPLLSQLSLDIDGHVRKAALKAIETISNTNRHV